MKINDSNSQTTELSRRDVVIGVNIVEAVKELAPGIDLTKLREAVIGAIRRSRNEIGDTSENENAD